MDEELFCFMRFSLELDFALFNKSSLDVDLVVEENGWGALPLLVAAAIFSLEDDDFVLASRSSFEVFRLVSNNLALSDFEPVEFRASDTTFSLDELLFSAVDGADLASDGGGGMALRFGLNLAKNPCFFTGEDDVLSAAPAAVLVASLAVEDLRGSSVSEISDKLSVGGADFLLGESAAF